MGDELLTPDGSEENSPFHSINANRLIMLVDSDWPQPVISNAASEKANKKAKRRIRECLQYKLYIILSDFLFLFISFALQFFSFQKNKKIWILWYFLPKSTITMIDCH